MQAASFDSPSSLIPRQDASAGSFCDWPRACSWPAEAQAPQAQAPLGQRLQASLFHAEDATLPPEVEQCALFSDGLETPAQSQSGNWFLRMWRYQGLGL